MLKLFGKSNIFSSVMMRGIMLLIWCGIGAFFIYQPFSTWFMRSEKIVRIFAWPDIFSSEVIEAFEKETGITVQMNYYASNEELLVKLSATRGTGYDLIIPSDYAVKLLRERNLLKKIDYTQLSFWKSLDSRLLYHACDPTNEYSIPFSWEIFGIGISKSYFKNSVVPDSWSLLFEKPLASYKIIMTNDPLEAVYMASLYLYHNPLAYEHNQAEVEQLLRKQRGWVEAYAATRGHYFLASGNSPIAVGSSSYLLRAGKQFDDIDFIVPREGAFVTIEHCALPIGGMHEQEVYQFLNFVYQQESRQQHLEELFIFPAIIDDLAINDLHSAAHLLVQLSLQEFKKLHFFQPVASEQQLYHLWTAVKS